MDLRIKILTSSGLIHLASTSQHRNQSYVHQHIHINSNRLYTASKLIKIIIPNTNKPLTKFAPRFAPRNHHVHIQQNGIQDVRAHRVPSCSCSPPIIHKNNRHELCKKTPQYLQTTKNGICAQCRTKNWEASMARSRKVDTEEQYGNKGTPSGLAVGSKNEVSHRTRLPRTNNGEFGPKKQSAEGTAANSSTRTKLPNEGEDFRCQLGLSHPGIPCQRAKDRNDKFPHHGKTANSEPSARGGGRTLLRLRGSESPALSKCDQRLPRLSLPGDKIKAITGAERGKDEQKVALHGPRALPEPHPITKENWNLIAVTNPVGREDKRRVRLYGPRDLPTTHRTIREDWDLMTVTNPLRRGEGGRLHLRRPRPIPSPSLSPIPRPNPAANSFGARQRKAFDFEPLIRQEVSLPADPTAQEAEQRIGPDTIPLLPMSYKPILTGRHPLHCPLPPIPDETNPKQDADCQPPPVPPHVVLYQRKAIAIHAHSDFDSPIERCTSAPDAPTGTYLGRETSCSGWQPARAETVISSFSV